MGRLHCIFLAVALSILAGSAADLPARGKDTTSFVRGSELSLTWGVAPLDYILMGDNFGTRPFPDVYDGNSITDYLYSRRYYGGNGYITGAVNIAYSYRFKKWFELSLIFSYSGYFRQFYDTMTDRPAFRQNGFSVSFVPFVRFVWLNRPVVKMYSGLGIGCSFAGDVTPLERSTVIIPAIDITPIGIKVGKKIYGLAEVSLGTTGAVSAGIGYRF